MLESDIKHIQCSKEELDRLMQSTIPSNLLLGKSKIAGLGIFASCFISKGTIFPTNVIGKVDINGEFKDYYWYGGLILDGIGYFANGSCKMFEKYEVGTKIGKFVAVETNMMRMRIRDNTYQFIATRDI